MRKYSGRSARPFGWCVFLIAACCYGDTLRQRAALTPQPCRVFAAHQGDALPHTLSLRLVLRGGGKGGCKAKHLSGKGKGRHFLVTKHAFPNLRLGAAHAVATGDNSSLATIGTLRARSDSGRYRAEDPNDSDSYSSWEVEEQHAKLHQRITSVSKSAKNNTCMQQSFAYTRNCR